MKTRNEELIKIELVYIFMTWLKSWWTEHWKMRSRKWGTMQN
jgi:hypothetical protein